MSGLLIQVPFTLIFVVLMLYLIAFCKQQFYYAGRTVEKVNNIPNWHSSLALKAHMYLRTRENSIKNFSSSLCMSVKCMAQIIENKMKKQVRYEVCNRYLRDIIKTYMDIDKKNSIHILP